MKRWHILAVDDEPLNLEIIREGLDDPQYVIDTVDSADRAWQILQRADCHCDLILLDWMMPGMSGIELLRRLKAIPRLRPLPVIMQTAAGAPEQVREGIAAGAYYYLTKPYGLEALRVIVRAALNDFALQQEALDSLRQRDREIELLDTATFHFATIEETHHLAGMLAKLCPHPEEAVLGLTELLVNAVEHGNLGIDYAEKTRLRRAEQWEAEVDRRLAMPEYRNRRGHVTVGQTGDMLEFIIVDEGGGFDWRRYLDFDPERSGDPNGRGIAMARALSFDRLEYRGCGNIAVAAVALQSL